MNQPKDVRGMYIADEGHVFVTFDVDSGEYRLAGYVSGEPNIIEPFDAYDAKTGPKIHLLNMSNIFGFTLEQAKAGYEGALAPIYTATKSIIYATLYGSGEMTAYDTARAEMPDLKLDHFLACYARFKNYYATFFRWMKNWVELGAKRHWLETPLMQRRMYFYEPTYGGEDSSEATVMTNFAFQGGLNDYVTMANTNVQNELLIPWQKKLKRGEKLQQKGQIHDELWFMVPNRLVEEFVPKAKAIIERRTVQRPDWRLPWSSSVKAVDATGKSRWAPLDAKCPCKGKKPDCSLCKGKGKAPLWELYK
jgi:DNA polymerase I-like protein with 3'-5' exonuclease and polymerase domains